MLEKNYNFIPILDNPITENEAFKMLPMSLAFIGDSVHSMIVRTQLTIGNEKHTNVLHKEVSSVVCAKYQAKILDKIKSELTETESDIFRRTRNSRIHTTAKHATNGEYRKASGFEAVIGFLYLTGQTERMCFLLELGTRTSEEEK